MGGWVGRYVGGWVGRYVGGSVRGWVGRLQLCAKCKQDIELVFTGRVCNSQFYISVLC